MQCSRHQVHEHAGNAITSCDQSGAGNVSASETHMPQMFDVLVFFRFLNEDVLRSSTDRKYSGSAVRAVLPEF